jgi:hypothetical protein
MEKIKETTSVRLHLDLRLSKPADAEVLKRIADGIEEHVRKIAYTGISLAEANVTQIIPAEGEQFDWSPLDGSEADRG